MSKLIAKLCLEIGHVNKPLGPPALAAEWGQCYKVTRFRQKLECLLLASLSSIV
jgi:hypothetical protein